MGSVTGTAPIGSAARRQRRKRKLPPTTSDRSEQFRSMVMPYPTNPRTSKPAPATQAIRVDRTAPLKHKVKSRSSGLHHIGMRREVEDEVSNCPFGRLVDWVDQPSHRAKISPSTLQRALSGNRPGIHRSAKLAGKARCKGTRGLSEASTPL